MKRRLAVLLAYAVAMAFVEAAVVVYLRQLYPSAVLTSAVPFSPLDYRVEVLREAATIVMLLCVAYLAFKELMLKVLTFLWIFAIWDLFYYVFLKLILGWPSSLKTLDVLFLIPVPWIAPVWLPIAISSLVFLGGGFALLRLGRDAD